MYKRILLKLSGESLQGTDGRSICEQRLVEYADQIIEASRLGVQIGIVIGGGNIFRGLRGIERGFDRVGGDQMGMLATVINSLALQSAIESGGGRCRVLTAIRMEPIAEFYSKRKAIESLERGEIVIFSAGTGSPYFTTDTGASLRAVEIEAGFELTWHRDRSRRNAQRHSRRRSVRLRPREKPQRREVRDYLVRRSICPQPTCNGQDSHRYVCRKQPAYHSLRYGHSGKSPTPTLRRKDRYYRNR